MIADTYLTRLIMSAIEMKIIRERTERVSEIHGANCDAKENDKLIPQQQETDGNKKHKRETDRNRDAEENDKFSPDERGNTGTEKQPRKTATELAVTALHVLSTLLLIIICAFLLTQHFRLNRLQTFQSATAEKILNTFTAKSSSGNLTAIQLESMLASDTVSIIEIH